MRTIFLTTLIGLLALTAGFSSCSKDGDEGSGTLVGVWIGDGSNKKAEGACFEFAADGRWYWWYERDSKPTKPEGTYKYEGNTISLTYSDPLEPIWGTVWNVKSLTTSKLVIAIGGNTATLNKKK